MVDYCIIGNYGIEVYFVLVYVGIFLFEFVVVDGYKWYGLCWLENEVKVDILDDGMYFEFIFGYYMNIVMCYSCAECLVVRNNIIML